MPLTCNIGNSAENFIAFAKKFQINKKGDLNITTYGYARVSTKEQNEQRQLIALINFGVNPKNIYMDKQSGKDFQRQNYQKLVYRKLKKGDVLVVKSIDRLGRSYTEVLQQWENITQHIGANIVILDMPLLDTRRNNDLTGMLISGIVLQLLSYVAQSERENIIQRQSEGIAAAKNRGVKFGRPKKPVPLEFIPLYRQWQDGDISRTEVENALGISKMQFYRLAKRLELEQDTQCQVTLPPKST